MDSDKLVSATFTGENDTNVYYSLTVHVEGNGSVAPSGGSYVKGSVVALEANADAGNEFVSWSGDINGTSTSTSVIMDTNKSVTATFQVSDGYVCENPAAILVPFSHDGEGEFCWVTSGDIAYVNSWNMEQVEINGVGYTNVWSDNLPAKIDGSYYIYCRGLYSWSHLEVTALKSTKWDDATGTEISVYPNPYSEKLIILLDKPEFVQGLSIIDQAGRTVYSFSQSEISARIELDKGFDPGVYLLKMVANNSIEIRQIIHK